MQTQATGGADRRHDIDALRVFAFALLIAYHVGMFYVADWGYHLKSAYLAEWLQWPMRLVNQWRMPLLFLISGLAVNFVLRRADGWRFARLRIRRLLLPLAFGMAVVVPPQAYLQAVSNGAFQGHYGAFLVHYFSFRPWPPGAFDGSYFGLTWNHLWYLPYLLVYSLLLAALLPVLRSRAGTAVRAWFRDLRGLRLWLLPAVPLTLAAWLLAGPFPTTHDLLSDWHNHAQSFTVFLFGYLIGADPGLWAELRRQRRRLLVAAMLTFAGYVVLNLATVPGITLERAAFELVRRLNTWTWILLVLAWGHHLLNRPFRWLPYATEAVYPWYILHQTITLVAGYWLAKLSLGPLLEPALVIAATVAGCLLLHEFAIRRSTVLRPLFGLKPRSGQAKPQQNAQLPVSGRTQRYKHAPETQL